MVTYRTPAQYHRMRGLERRSLMSGMSATHSWAPGSTINVGTAFTASQRGEPITFAIPFRRTGGALDGILLDLGSATRGLCVWSGGDSLGIAAGGGSGDLLNGIGGITGAEFGNAAGRTFELTVAINAGTGAVRVWSDGRLLDLDADDASPIRPYMVVPNGSFSWSDTDGGAVGDEGGASHNVRAFPDVTATPLSNAVIAGEVKAYAGQLPRGFVNP